MEDVIKCPHCAEVIKQEATMCRFCQRGLSLTHFKKCGFCKEMVRIKATYCRFCSHDLSEPPPKHGPFNGAPVPRSPSGGPALKTEVALSLPQPQGELEMPKPRRLKRPEEE